MNKLKTPMGYLGLILGSFLCVYPLLFMIIAMTHSSGDVISYPPPTWFGDYFLTNYDNLQKSIDIFRGFRNSLFVALIFTSLNLIISSTAGYGFAKFEFKYKKAIFGLVLITMMLPTYARLIPLYRMMIGLGLANTHAAVMLPDISAAFGIFLMRQNFQAIPNSLIESARMDGAGELKIFFRIVMPLMIPSLSALGIYMFMFQWGNFTWPLIILNSEEMMTLPIMLSRLRGATRIDYGQVMFGASYAILPILVVFFMLQRYFISGLTSGAVKE